MARAGMRARLWLAAAAAPCLPVPLAAAQGTLVHATMHAEAGLPADGTTHVRIVYIIDGGGATALDVRAIRFGGVTLGAVQATLNGETALVTRPDADGAMVRARVALPLALRDDSTLRAELRYTVHAPATARSDERVRIPVFAPAWPPRAALPETFRVNVTLRDGVAAWDAFPATLREVRSADGARTYAATLQVVPAAVSFTARAGAPPRLTLALALDTGVLALLVLSGVVGWRRFRSRR